LNFEQDNPPKRPEGMHRELYALLCADGGKNFQELAPVLPTDLPGGYKKKVQLGAKKVRKWTWTPFTHPGRKDNPFLCHWRRIGEEIRDYPFARFDIVSIYIMEFTS
jgi:DNA methyltransferase 1-associated protein 1